MDKYGNMIPASESLNTIDVNGKKYANIYHTLAESDHVYAPTVRSGRMYLSYENLFTLHLIQMLMAMQVMQDQTLTIQVM